MDAALNDDAGIVCIECIVFSYRFFVERRGSIEQRERRCACEGIVDKCKCVVKSLVSSR